jgi:integrase
MTQQQRRQARRPANRTPGTVSFISSTGKWRARYVDPLDGKQKHLGTFNTERDALLALREKAVALDNEAPAQRARRASQTTIGELFTEWLRYKATDVTPSTLLRYQSMGARTIVTPLGARRVVSFTARDAHAWLSTITSPSTRTASYRLLKGLFDYAVTIDLIESSPVMIKGAGTGRAVKVVPPQLTDDEFERIVAGLSLLYQSLVIVARRTGLRRGELVALRRRDVDLAARVIHVQQSWDDVTRTFKSPKSLLGVRAVPMGDAYETLRTLLLAIPARRDALLWANRDDAARPIALTRLHTAWHVATAAAGRPDVNFHQLRHAYGTELMQAGVPLPDLMTAMGHRDVSTTMRYQRPALTPDEVAARVTTYRASQRAARASR